MNSLGVGDFSIMSNSSDDNDLENAEGLGGPSGVKLRT